MERSAAWVWDKVKGVIGGSPLKFMIGILVISTIPGMFVTYSSFQVTKYMVLSWSVMGLVDAYVAGLILAKMNK